MRIRQMLPLGAVAVAALVGCNGSGSSKKSAASTVAPIASVTTNTGTTGPIMSAAPTGPRILKATFASVTSSGRAAKGDEVTVSFSKEVVVKPAAADPDLEFSLPVKGNTFGAGATLRSGALKTDVVITLGADPVLRISGTFDVAHVGSGDASGVGIPAAATGNIATPTGDKPIAGDVDLDGPYTEEWRVAGTLNVPRAGHTATLLKDGRILIVGGFRTIPASGSNPAGVGYAFEPEIYDPLAGTFTKTNVLGGRTGDMLVGITVGGTNYALQVARTYHTATLLDDGRVLVAGGFGWERVDSTGKLVQSDLMSAHVFDPNTNQFTLAQGTLSLPRSRHYATPLGDGTVLIAGGINNALGNPPQPLTLPVGEIFDPKTGVFTRLSQNGLDMTVPRMDGVAAFDATTKTVNFVGGVAMYVPQGATQPVIALSGGAEVFDVATKKFSGNASKPALDLRWQASAMVGPDLWTFGGSGVGGATGLIEGCVQNTFSGTAVIGSQVLATPRARAQAAALGSIVVVAGGTSLSGKASHELASCEVWNADSHVLQKAPDMKAARNLFTLTAVGDKLYAIGGFNGDPGPSGASLGGQTVATCEVYSRP